MRIISLVICPLVFAFVFVACGANSSAPGALAPNSADVSQLDTANSIGGNLLVDERDGQTYRIVTIGELTWMAQNLNYAMDSSWCYANDPANCAVYGRFYEWKAANMACPSGWHLPYFEDWEKLLFNDVGSYDAIFTGMDLMLMNQIAASLRSTTGWVDGDNGTDSYGFSALPAGLQIFDGSFINNGSEAYFWSATFHGAGQFFDGERMVDDIAIRYFVFKASYSEEEEGIAATSYWRQSNMHLNVRCVRD